MTNESPGLPRRVGAYRILRELGEGGTGIVYLALREGAHHPVALKILRVDARTESFQLRFRAEAKHLERLRHPGIAALLDAGAAPMETAAGSHEVPFLALELVEGVSILAHAERNELDLAARLELLARTCDAVQHAHDRGIVHRDLKPANVLVTEGEDGIGAPKVVDFGVARAVEDEGGQSATLTASLVGTVPYMSPEQVAGARNLDGRSDVYSLGVVLYQLVTGRLPYDVQGRPLAAAARAIQLDDPAPLGLGPVFSGKLALVVGEALEKAPRDRYPSPAALAADLRACVAGKPVQATAPGMIGKARRFATRHPVAASTLGLLFAAFATMLSLWLRALSDRADASRSGEAARQAAELATERAGLAMRVKDQVLRLSDARTLDALIAESETLWPAWPTLLPDLDRWLGDAAALADERADHERFLAELVDPASLTARSIAPDELAWWEAKLTELVERLAAFAGPAGELDAVRRRRADADTIEHLTLVDAADAWREAGDAIANLPVYGGLQLEPQIGLVPLGPDPYSGLWEFWHVTSGTEPARDAEGLLTMDEDAGIVLVLIPPGEFAMGATPARDPLAASIEAPVHEVRLSPFFLAKFELTQGQWLRCMGSNPSRFAPEDEPGENRWTLAQPVETISWEEASRFAFQQGLQLPTEAQWEYACRADTDTPWWPGPEASELVFVANLADLAAFEEDPEIYPDHEAWDDGFPRTSPAGSFAPNGFGLHDVHGNVFEWVRDAFDFDFYASSPSLDPCNTSPTGAGQTYRVIRGGSFQVRAALARCSLRFFYDKRGTKTSSIGVRVGRGIEGYPDR